MPTIPNDDDAGAAITPDGAVTTTATTATSSRHPLFRVYGRCLCTVASATDAPDTARARNSSLSRTTTATPTKIHLGAGRKSVRHTVAAVTTLLVCKRRRFADLCSPSSTPSVLTVCVSRSGFRQPTRKTLPSGPSPASLVDGVCPATTATRPTISTRKKPFRTPTTPKSSVPEGLRIASVEAVTLAQGVCVTSRTTVTDAHFEYPHGCSHSADNYAATTAATFANLSQPDCTATTPTTADQQILQRVETWCPGVGHSKRGDELFVKTTVQKSVAAVRNTAFLVILGCTTSCRHVRSGTFPQKNTVHPSHYATPWPATTSVLVSTQWIVACPFWRSCRFPVTPLIQ